MSSTMDLMEDAVETTDRDALLLASLDEALSLLHSRTLIPTTEIADILLDMRLIVAPSFEEAVSG